MNTTNGVENQVPHTPPRNNTQENIKSIALSEVLLSDIKTPLLNASWYPYRHSLEADTALFAHAAYAGALLLKEDALTKELVHSNSTASQESPLALSKMAHDAYAANDFEQALCLFSLLVYLQHRTAESWFCLGDCLYHGSHYSTAIMAYSVAAHLEPTMAAWGYLCASQACDAAGDMEEAHLFVKRASEEILQVEKKERPSLLKALEEQKEHLASESESRFS